MLSIVRTPQCIGRQIVRNTRFSVITPFGITKRYATHGVTEPKKIKLESLDTPLGDHKTLVASSVALTVAIPMYFVFPNLVNWILVFAIPPHIAVGLKHVISDYTKLNARLWGWILALLVFVALFRLTKNSVGLVGLFEELFKEGAVHLKEEHAKEEHAKEEHAK